MNKYSIIKSFLKRLLQEDSETLLNDTGVQFKAWMEANGMTMLANKPEFHDQFQEIVPIINDNTINMLSKKLFVYNYYWLVTTNNDVSPSFLASTAALLVDKNEKLVAETAIEEAMKLLFKATNEPLHGSEEIIYTTNKHPSFTTAIDLLQQKQKHNNFDGEFISYDDDLSELQIHTHHNDYKFNVQGTLISTESQTGNKFVDVESELSEQASEALKIWMNSANIFVKEI
mgnify:CR=1 FL=1